MTPNEYQKAAARTLYTLDEMPNFSPHDISIVWNTVGLVGEIFELQLRTPRADILLSHCGYLLEYVKKGVLHQHGLNVDVVSSIMGLILADAARLMRDMGSDRVILYYDPLGEELGDVLWYVAALCTRLDVDMDDLAATYVIGSNVLAPIFEQNIEKLKKRFPTDAGFTTADSIARVDVEVPGA